MEVDTEVEHVNIYENSEEGPYDLVIDLGYKDGDIVSFRESDTSMEFQGRVLSLWSTEYSKKLTSKKSIRKCRQNINNSYAEVYMMMKLQTPNTKFPNIPLISEYAQTGEYHVIPTNKIVGKVNEIVIYDLEEQPSISRADITETYQYPLTKGVIITSCIISQPLNSDEGEIAKHEDYPPTEQYFTENVVFFAMVKPLYTVAWYHFDPFVLLSDFYIVIKDHIFDPFLDPDSSAARTSRQKDRGSSLWYILQIYMTSIYMCTSSEVLKVIIDQLENDITESKRAKFVSYYCHYPFATPLAIQETQLFTPVQTIVYCLFQIHSLHKAESGIAHVMFFLETMKYVIETTVERGLIHDGRKKDPKLAYKAKLVDDDDNTINSCDLENDNKMEEDSEESEKDKEDDEIDISSSDESSTDEEDSSDEDDDDFTVSSEESEKSSKRKAKRSRLVQKDDDEEKESSIIEIENNETCSQTTPKQIIIKDEEEVEWKEERNNIVSSPKRLKTEETIA